MGFVGCVGGGHRADATEDSGQINNPSDLLYAQPAIYPAQQQLQPFFPPRTRVTRQVEESGWPTRHWLWCWPAEASTTLNINVEFLAPCLEKLGGPLHSFPAVLLRPPRLQTAGRLAGDAWRLEVVAEGPPGHRWLSL